MIPHVAGPKAADAVVTEAEKRMVPCPLCGAARWQACHRARQPSANTLGGGWGGPGDLKTAHPERRAAFLSATAGKTRPKIATLYDTGVRVLLAPRTETGPVPCTGEAHANPFIDNCMQCAPAWGTVMSYARLFPDACKEGYAVPVSHGDRIAFEAAEAAGEVQMVSVTETFKHGSMCSFYAWVAK